MRVHKLDLQGRVSFTYACDLVRRLPNGVLVSATWQRPPLPLGYTTFEPGDLFLEWYYTDRWYNVFQISGADGVLKGWYCNITEPAVLEGETLSYRDLLLDLWVAPDGTMRTLDEDEFAAEAALSATTRAAALAALADLRARVARREPPFSAIATHADPPRAIL